MKKNLSLREIQLYELKIAKELKRVCEANNIDYFMDDGTLLGAVRHGGFIPWDDDMDFGMTLDNYKRFIAVAPKQLDKHFMLQHWDDGSSYSYPFCKIKLLNSTVIEKASRDSNINKGIWVDIFPIRRISEKEASSKSYIWKLRLLNRELLLKNGVDLSALTKKKYVKFANFILYHMPGSTDSIKKKLKAILFSPENESDNCFIECDGMFGGQLIYRNDYFSDLEELKFEDTTFKGSERYKDYLTAMYGDYMKLPPIEEREKGHSILEAYIEE